MNILYCAYRDWALDVIKPIKQKLMDDNIFVEVVSDKETMLMLSREHKWDIIFLVGWSWLIPNDVIINNFVVGMHPSDLPKYAGGSPIQNQVIDGVEDSVVTLFMISDKLDAGDVLAKRSYDLRGHLSDVLQSLTVVTRELIHEFITEHPHHNPTKQEHGDVKKRLKPEQSKIQDIGSMTTKNLYDIIRCREDVISNGSTNKLYPSAYIEDEYGKLYFTRVEFEPKKQ